MDTARLSQLEQDPAMVAKYIKAAAFGKNKIVYAPLLIGVGLAIFLGYGAYEGILSSIGTGATITLGVLCVLCFMLAGLIHKAALKKLKAITRSAPLSIAKKIYGNEDAGIFYCIYTDGAKRQDSGFITGIAEKIFAIPAGTKDPLEKTVSNMFRPDFANPNEFARRLPQAFTGNETVWRKQFSFALLDKNIQQRILQDQDCFIVVVINPENAKIAREYYQ